MNLLTFIQSGDPIVYFLGASSLIKFAAMRNWHRRIAPNAKLVGKVTALNVFPVKSMKGIPVCVMDCATQGPLTESGIHDRQWTITTSEGMALTAKLEPRLHLITTGLTPGSLTLSAPGMETISISTNLNVQKHALVENTEIVHVNVPGVDCGDEVSKWIEKYLDKPGSGYRLLYFSPALPTRHLTYGPERLLGSTKDDDQILYHDESPYYLVNESSFKELNDRLDKKCEMANLRPNIVMDGSDAYAEDFWEEIYIGGAKFTNYIPCDRCAKSLVDQDTGKMRQDGEPLKTLRKYRMLTPEFDGPCFGRMMVLDRAGSIQVGDSVYATLVSRFIG